MAYSAHRPWLDDFNDSVNAALLLIENDPSDATACAQLVQDIDRLISALSFPLPLSATSKPNGQEVVNDLVTLLGRLKSSSQVRLHWPALVHLLSAHCTAQAAQMNQQQQQQQQGSSLDDHSTDKQVAPASSSASSSSSLQPRNHQELAKVAASLSLDLEVPLSDAQVLWVV